METIHYTTLTSPLGDVLVAGGAQGLRRICFLEGERRTESSPDWIHEPGSPHLAEPLRQLEAYFAGKRRVFSLSLHPQGTQFQRKVWQALCGIAYGETITYGELARRIGQPSASRAVGAANGRNPLPVVVPCHRVIGADGSLTGYGGGLPIKEALLALEDALPSDLMYAAGSSVQQPSLFE